MIELEDRIGYHFKNKELLTQALTHSSYINEHALSREACNERLEFLGDSIVEFVSSRYLYSHYPDEMEGRLSKMRSALVCEKGLADSARQICLGDYLILGNGMELGGGRLMESITSDAFEALVAAVFLDSGIEEAARIVETYVMDHMEEKVLFYDAKTILQEIVQEKGKQVTYELLEESGPDHSKHFRMNACIDGIPAGNGEGNSKKQAEQNAAYETILKIRNGLLCI